MKLISIDIETSGLDPETNQILQVGAVIFDPAPLLIKDRAVNSHERRPKTFCVSVKHDTITGDAYALNMNARLIAQIAGEERSIYPIVGPEDVCPELQSFIREHTGLGEKLTVVGKNYSGFDAQFLCRLPYWDLVSQHLERRVLDVGSLLFDPEHGRILNLTECLALVGIRKSVSHDALEDALDTMSVVRRKFEDTNPY